VVALWTDHGWDLDLDGAAIPLEFTPDGFLYPLETLAAGECVFENVGPDIM